MCSETLIKIWQFLYPKYDADIATELHTLSIIVVLIDKLRRKVDNAWEAVTFDEPKFAALTLNALTILLNESSSLLVKKLVLVFLVNIFQSLENAVVRAVALPLVSLSIWHNIVPEKRKLQFAQFPQLLKVWNKLEKKYKNSGTSPR